MDELIKALDISGAKAIKENNNATVLHINTNKEEYVKTVTVLREMGAVLREERTVACHTFAALSVEGGAYFLNYFETTGELYITYEKDSRYFEFSSECGKKVVTPEITQIALEDFGLSYVVRLSDGRFIVFDGGWDFEPDREKLLNCLKKGTKEGKPTVAAWILTHPHVDHFECFVGFMENYADEIELESLLYTFPEADDTERYPHLLKHSGRVDFDSSAYTYIKKLENIIKEHSIKVYSPHTGQKYTVGDATLEILSSMDDIMHHAHDINATSLVTRMELAGQVILWCADASLGKSAIAEKYGDYLKSDILQVPHHGFGCGSAQGEIDAYNLIKPETAFIPVAPYHGYTVFSIHKPSTRYLMTNLGVKEIIMGIPERTISLPYIPAEYRERETRDAVEQGIRNCGAKTWMFTGLNTSVCEDFVFTALNTTVDPATILIEIFFEDASKNIEHIKATVTRKSVKTFSIIGDEIDSEWKYFNPASLKKRGIPENESFAVRFMSDIPIIISSKNHKADYYSN